MKKLFVLLFIIPVLAFAEPLHSPTWGFCIDLPEGYEYVDGDGKDRFSFAGPEGLMCELIVYNGKYNSMLELANDVNKTIANKGEVDLFQYRDKQAVMIRLAFGSHEGWALGVELDNLPKTGTKGSLEPRPYLLALAYGPADKKQLDLFNASALDSIAPSYADRYYPGPLTEYISPRGEAKKKELAIKGLSAMIYDNDAIASQGLIEREFKVMEAYLNTDMLQAACIRYYRFVFRDSCDRVTDAASVIARHLGSESIKNDKQKTEFAQKVLNFTQDFKYERDLKGSDFINLVSAVTEGKGDCDSRAMLFAMILAHADIKSGIMLSHHYSHAMGLADIPGEGARFDAHQTKWLVAETTAKINIGLIDQQQSNPQFWFAILFE